MDGRKKHLRESDLSGIRRLHLFSDGCIARNYKGKTNRANINEDTMRHSLQQVLSKSMSQREATRVYGIKRLQDLERWNLQKKVGVDLLHGFMKKNSTLSLRKPESTSLARELGFIKARVDEFFGNYKSVLEKYEFTPDQIFSLDETGITTVLSPPKVVAPKGKKLIGLVAAVEKGELVTFVGIISATGNALPPVYIFPRVRKIEDYLEDGPALSSTFGNKSGWMTEKLFVKTLEHIVKHTRCNNENEILLLIDNHESHTTLAAILFARENGIVLLSFPPHTSHKLQPLDVEVFGPFKGRCAVSLNDWMSSNPGRTITVKHVHKLTKNRF
ncbi:hypothetical protein ILUMI_18476 [Ignelater luminosus]|uniref:DDE-1 domain-containing protein n=1 Tax=Ignelater luminosus TaxID=2038154 RepID=A0A8K0G434_IGNLU|nr:hypothetical protein ILUMI_18476 [Ignelater luminosus]